MSRYIRIASKFWTDEKTIKLPEDARFLFLYLLTSPHSNMVGYYYLPKLYACHDMGWEMERFTKAFTKLLEERLIYYCDTTSVILVPNFLKYNPIQNKNQAIGAVKAVQELPTNTLFPLFMQCLERFAKPFTKPFEEAFPERYANTETDTETETETETEEESTSPTGDPPPQKDYIPYKEIVELYNKTCTSLPKVEKITDKRRRHIKKTWGELKNLLRLEEAFQKAEASDFLSGRNGKWTGCSFDWLITYNNIVKVLEGTYDNKKGGVENGAGGRGNTQIRAPAKPGFRPSEHDWEAEAKVDYI